MAVTFDPRTGLPAGFLTDTTSSAHVAAARAKASVTPPVAPATPTPPTVPGDPVVNPPAAPTSSLPSIQDLQQLIENDPLYKQTQADIAASRIADQAGLSAARARALTMFGDVPTDVAQANPALVGNVAGDITDTVRQLAAQNTEAGNSTVARLKQAYDENIHALQNSLAARGILSSGETGYQLGKQNLSYQQSRYDAIQQLLDLLAGYQSSYLTNDAALRAQLNAAAQAAAGRIPPDTVSPPAPPSFGFGPSNPIPDYFAPLNNLTPADWAKIAALPINRKSSTSAARAAVPA